MHCSSQLGCTAQPLTLCRYNLVRNSSRQLLNCNSLTSCFGAFQCFAPVLKTLRSQIGASAQLPHDFNPLQLIAAFKARRTCPRAVMGSPLITGCRSLGLPVWARWAARLEELQTEDDSELGRTSLDARMLCQLIQGAVDQPWEGTVQQVLHFHASDNGESTPHAKR